MIIPKYFEDNHIFGVNDEPMRAYYIPTSPAQDPNWMSRTETDRFLSLNGDWKFRYFDSIYDCQEAFYDEGYDTCLLYTSTISSCRCWIATATVLSPSKGTRPVTISYMTIPRE